MLLLPRFQLVKVSTSQHCLGIGLSDGSWKNYSELIEQSPIKIPTVDYYFVFMCTLDVFLP
jgi:hypothetical protein